MNLAKQARTRQGFIAKPLFAYQDCHQLDDEQLASAVGVTIDQLPHLALCALPKSKEDIATIARHVNANLGTLMTWLETETHDNNLLPDWARPDKQEEH